MTDFGELLTLVLALLLEGAFFFLRSLGLVEVGEAVAGGEEGEASLFYFNALFFSFNSFLSFRSRFSLLRSSFSSGVSFKGFSFRTIFVFFVVSVSTLSLLALAAASASFNDCMVNQWQQR
jgi:hypothetical protein